MPVCPSAAAKLVRLTAAGAGVLVVACAPADAHTPSTGAVRAAATPASTSATPAWPIPVKDPACTAKATGAYAVVTFLQPMPVDYSSGAINGTWDDLHHAEMVHYSTTAAPGQAGNAIFAFHREPVFRNLDAVVAGQRITVADNACDVWTYTVDSIWQGPPPDVPPSALSPAATGARLTLITTTPFGPHDVNRLVIEAHLV